MEKLDIHIKPENFPPIAHAFDLQKASDIQNEMIAKINELVDQNNALTARVKGLETKRVRYTGPL